ncbi:uncharacterized protein UDID_17070 [Ustilago sp. UG-2017a]|nr:uncharacterized protein UDID_17070 [Ustilago sp. UG-2017a]
MTEVEYIALVAAAREMLWMSMFLQELDQLLLKMLAIHVIAGTTALHSHKGNLTFNLTTPILYSDSAGTCVIANDPQHFKRTKHIDITHFFLQDEVADGHLIITPVQSSENLANILTKPLTVPTLLHLRQLFGLTVLKGYTGLRGVPAVARLKPEICGKRQLLLISARSAVKAFCHGPECSGSRRVTGSYGRSIGIGELVDTRREHGRSAVSMETMDSYGFTCKGGPGPYARRASMKRTKLKEQAQP